MRLSSLSSTSNTVLPFSATAFIRILESSPAPEFGGGPKADTKNSSVVEAARPGWVSARIQRTCSRNVPSPAFEGQSAIFLPRTRGRPHHVVCRHHLTQPPRP